MHDDEALQWLTKQSERVAGRSPLGYLTVVSQLLVLPQMGLLALAIHQIWYEGVFHADMRWLLLAGISLACIRAIFQFLGQKSVLTQTEQHLLSLRKTFQHTLAQLPDSLLLNHSSAELATLAGDGIQSLHDYLSQYRLARLKAAAVPVLIWLCILPVDWISSLIFLLTAPLLPFFLMLAGWGTEARNQAQWQFLLRLRSGFMDGIRGLISIRQLGSTEQMLNRLRNIAEDYRDRTMHVLRVAFLSSLVMEFFATLSIALLAVWAGFRLLWGELDPLQGLFILLLAPEFFTPIRALSQQRHHKMQALASAKNLLHYLNLPIQAAGTRSLPPQNRGMHIRCSNLSMSYPQSKAVLNGLNLDILPGEKLVITGPSGSGKTTLLKTLIGLENPDGGSIYLDGIELGQLSLQSVHHHIAWLPQKPEWPLGSLRSQLLGRNTHISDEKMQSVLGRVGLSSWYQTLTEGLDSIVSERANNLSGGQAQRLAIARLLLSPPVRLLLMDEPTSSLDHDSQQFLLRELRNWSENMTVIRIAHQLNTISDNDRVLFMVSGSIAQAGLFSEIKSISGPFKTFSMGLI